MNVAALDEPYGVVTMTLTAQAACAGDVTVNDESDPTDSAVPATPSNVTLVAPVKPLPVNVTTIPPAVEPDYKDTPVTTGISVANVALIPVTFADATVTMVAPLYVYELL